ncbi:hypothetical protein LIER_04182 [Lithospermum erythrorhizon]|uniref:Uncharacterized protein n=1 Tax=Lithospermum erythrorhizon TaxID=34254 RepID=A0AAV3NW07_LITER
MGVRVCSISFIVLCCLFIMVHSSGIANSKNEEYVGEKKASVSEMVKCLYSISTSSPFTSEYWVKVRTLLDQGRVYLSSLNLDFKKVDNAAVNEGMGQKVKKTVVKCMEKSREAKKDDQSEL